MNKCLIIFGFAGLLLLAAAVKRLSVKELFFNVSSGIAAILGLNVLSGFFHFVLPLNIFTAAAGALGGLPGAVLVTVLCGIWK